MLILLSSTRDTKKDDRVLSKLRKFYLIKTKASTPPANFYVITIFAAKNHCFAISQENGAQQNQFYLETISNKFYWISPLRTHCVV